MDLSIRLATHDDLPATATILDFAVSNKMFRGDLAWGEKAYDEAALTAAMNRGALFVAESAGEIVATFRLELEDDAQWGQQPPVAAYVQRFATASGFRGQHLGSRIFDLIAQTVLASGRHYVRLICPAENSKLAAYHEANGFVRVDYKAHPTAPGARVVYYERLVDPNYQEPQATRTKGGFLGRFKRS